MQMQKQVLFVVAQIVYDIYDIYDIVYVYDIVYDIYASNASIVVSIQKVFNDHFWTLLEKVLLESVNWCTKFPSCFVYYYHIRVMQPTS